MKIATNILAILVACLLSSSAYASTVSFGDTSNIWPDTDASLAYKDYNGIPDITGGTATGHKGLDELTITYESPVNLRNTPYSRRLNPTGTAWSKLNFGDIFINTNPSQDMDWDIVIQATENINIWNIFQVDIPFVNDDYTLSYAPPHTGAPRYNHPIAIDLSDYSPELIGTATYDGWKIPGGNGAGFANAVTSTWLFQLFDNFSWGFDESTFVLGLTVTCANDVLYERIPVPAPEPSTWILFMFGLAGMLGYSTRKKS